MKRIIFLIFAMSCLIAAPVLAATGAVTLGSTTGHTKAFKTSKNVDIDYNSGTNGISYSVAAYHSKGAKTFASCSGAQVIYYQNGTAKSAPTAPTTANNTSDFSAWTAM